MDSLWRDVSYSFRSLRYRLGFTLFCTAILGVGIGLLATVFGMANAFLLRPLPFSEPDRLVHVWQTDANTGLDTLRVSVPNFRDWQDGLDSVRALGGYFYTSFALAESDQAASATRMTPELFSVLGTAPALGRAFARTDTDAGAYDLVVLSHAFWQRHFGARPDVLGETLLLDQAPHTVIGVMPRSFVFPFNSMDVYVPLDTSAWDEQRVANGPLLVVARMRADETLDSAQAELETLMSALEREYPVANAGKSSNVVELRSQLLFTYDAFQLVFPVLLAAIGFVLLMVWANIGNLLLARAIERGREIAFRIALGASRLRVVRQLMIESLLLSTFGALVGVVIAVFLTRLADGAIPGDLYRVGSIDVDWRGLSLVALTSAVSAVVFGLAPALKASGRNLTAAISGSGRGASEGRESHRLRALLVVGETAIALVLVIGALLMVQTYDALNRVDTGFATESISTVELRLSRNSYPEPTQQNRYFEDVKASLAGQPGVEDVSFVYPLPLNFESLGQDFELPGYVSSEGEVLYAGTFWVDPDYFRVMQIPILAGRAFTPSDREDSRPVVIVNREMAERYWPGTSPIGEMVEIKERAREVVGIAENAIAYALDENTPLLVYFPFEQESRRRRFAVASVTGDPETHAPALATSARAVDSSQTVGNARGMRRVVTTSMAPWLGAIGGLSVLGLGALALAAMGIYGVVSFSVKGRRRELSIRHAMGADRSKLRNMILRESLLLSGVGTVLGLGIGLAVARFVRSLVFGIASVDMLTFVGAGILLIGVAVAASYVPVRRALSANLSHGLRQD